MGKCALPDHLKEKPHNDYIWPFSLLSRGSNAYGPRCPKESESYRAWPPRLVEGVSVCRWESTGAGSIVEIPEFRDKRIDASIYGSTVKAIERNVGHPNFGIPRDLKLTWEDSMNPNLYSPSALQKFSRNGYLRLDPDYYSAWKILKWHEFPAIKEEKQPTKEDIVLFYRTKFRPDHLDVYYNKSIGTAGLHWE